MIWANISDYLTPFIGSIVVLIGIIFIPEVKKSTRLTVLALIIFVGTMILGFRKVSQDKFKEKLNQQKSESDSLKIENLNLNVRKLNQNLERDSLRFSEFKRQLELEFRIKDSANTPVKIHNYKPVFNTNIKKAENVKIG